MFLKKSKDEVKEEVKAEKSSADAEYNSAGIKRPVITLRGGRESALTQDLIKEISRRDQNGNPHPQAEEDQKVQRLALMLQRWEGGASQF